MIVLITYKHILQRFNKRLLDQVITASNSMYHRICEFLSISIMKQY